MMGEKLKRFRMISKVLKSTTEFDESIVPSFLLHSENKWWYKKYVLTLGVGDSKSTDFNKIIRIE